MPAQMWEDPAETSALEAAKAEMKRKQELALGEQSASQADEDPEKTREWEAIKRESGPQQQASGHREPESE